MCDLHSIFKACKSISGVKDHYFFSPDNVVNMPTGGGGTQVGDITFVDPSKVYHLQYTRNTASFKYTARDSRAGVYFDQEIVGFISRPRLEVELLIDKLLNKKVHAIITDNNGFQRYVWNVKLLPDYSTGIKKGEFNGYTLRWRGKSDNRTPVISGTIITDTNGDPIEGGGDSECCVVINPTQLAYVPTEMGNANNHNEFVTATDGTRWFIDKDGRGFNFNKTSGDIEITDISKGYIVKGPLGNRYRLQLFENGQLKTTKLP